MTMAIRIIPRPSASGRSPLLVSSAMVVVITRVTPSMFPPTIITAPTSAAARPNPARIVVSSEKRVSQRRVSAAFTRPAPSERSCSSYSRQASSIAWRESAAMIGRIRIACATTITEGVNRIPSAPSGPARESKRYTSSPTTTGGRPMSAFSNTITVCRPRKRPTAIAAPSGRPSRAAMATADRLTRKLSRTISISLASRPIRSASAALRAYDMIRGQLDRGFPYVQLDRTRASPVERNRFDQGVDVEPRRETELPRRARRNSGAQGRRADSDRDIDDPAALVSDRGDSPRKNVLDADALRPLERDRNVAGPDTHAHRLADQGIDAGRRQRASIEGERSKLVLHVLLDHLRVDHRAAFERARMQIGPTQDLFGRTDRGDFAGGYQHDGIGQAHHLLHRVADIDDRDPDLVAHQLDVLQHFVFSVRVERSERFIEQKQARTGEQGASDGHALFLAAGEVSRPAIEEVLQSEELDDVREFRLRRSAGKKTRIAQVLPHVQVREQASFLEHLADAPPRRRHVDAAPAVEYRLALDRDAPALRPQDAGDGIDDGGLARSRAAEKRRDAVTGL